MRRSKQQLASISSEFRHHKSLILACQPLSCSKLKHDTVTRLLNFPQKPSRAKKNQRFFIYEFFTLYDSFAGISPHSLIFVASSLFRNFMKLLLSGLRKTFSCRVSVRCCRTPPKLRVRHPLFMSFSFSTELKLLSGETCCSQTFMSEPKVPSRTCDRLISVHFVVTKMSCCDFWRLQRDLHHRIIPRGAL